MQPGTEGVTRKSLIRSFFYTILFNTIIASFLTVMNFGHGIYYNLIISQCIGLSICSCILITFHVFRTTGPAVKTTLIAAALLIGTTIGSILGAAAAGLAPSFFFKNFGFFFQILFLSVLFGAIITYIFASRERMIASEALFREEKIKRLTSEKETVEANLKLLQAQIEPHFLFNTLSNILSLLDTNPQKGKSMLVDFIQYLRASLSKIRQEKATLGQEMEMIQAYLNIYKVRMGDRLHYTIDLPNHLQAISFPPMLIQPLVENAVKHGLEPKIDGGEVLIRGAVRNGIFELEVIDTGAGFQGERDSGMGLSTIRDRLFSLYGNHGRLRLEENSPHGLKATIEVPYDQS